jgi:hypothetical protein
MQLAVLGQALDGRDLRALAGDRQRGAALHRLAVDMDDAGPALAGIAADMGASQAELVAQELDEQRAAFDLAAHGLSVHFHGNCWHFEFLPLSVRAGSRLPQAATPDTLCRAR